MCCGSVVVIELVGIIFRKCSNNRVDCTLCGADRVRV